METLTPEQIAKLPKWAQIHIANLDRRVVLSERALKEYQDGQTPSPFFYEDFLCVGGGPPKHTTTYIQTHKVSVIHEGVRADIMLRLDEPCIQIGWGDEHRGCREVAMIPTSFQQIKLLQKNRMRS